ncbi:MAG: CBS domain-containing protein [Streptosporangiales bacterium]|nr:CBS domain-containing protein [Streptosporangiales bacterium]MBO0890589.1 CBS domain-containing protein [Acidothermales bacterium]
MFGHPLVRDAMTADVVVALVDTRAPDLVELLGALRLRAVPVVDAYDHVVGFAARSDLLRGGPARHVPGRHKRLRFDVSRRTVGALMTTPAVTVTPETTVVGAGRLMTEHKVSRVPVVDAENTLRGIVTAGDLLKVVHRSDEEVRADVLDVLARFLPTLRAVTRVQVENGTVTLLGEVSAASTIPLAIHLARHVTGVVDVVDRYRVGSRENSHPVGFGRAGAPAA